MSYYSNYIKSVFCSLSSIAPDNLPALFGKKIILPTYHLVSETPPPHINSLYEPKTKKQFLKDLDYLLKYFKPISLSDLIDHVHKKRQWTENLFHLSFDDGLRECADIIAPLLKEKGVPATFFINPDFVGNKDLMFRYKASLLINHIKTTGKNGSQKLIIPIKNIVYADRIRLDDWAKELGLDYEHYLRFHQPYMSQEEIVRLISDGFTIGAHSMDHPEYSQVTYEEQLRQTKESIEYVTTTFQLNYKVFAFPFNDDFISTRFFDSVLGGKEPMADLIFGVAGIKEDYHIHHLQRIPMEKPFSGNTIIKGEYLYYSAKAPFEKNKIQRKKFPFVSTNQETD